MADYDHSKSDLFSAVGFTEKQVEVMKEDLKDCFKKGKKNSEVVELIESNFSKKQIAFLLFRMISSRRGEVPEGTKLVLAEILKKLKEERSK